MRRLLQRGWWLLLGLLLLAGLTQVRLDTDVLNLLPGQVPAVRGLQLYQRHFTNARELIVTVRATEAEAAEIAARRVAETLRGATNLVARVTWQPPWLEHPEQMAELIAYLWRNQPGETVAQLTRRLDPTNLNTIAREAAGQLATSLSPMDMARLSYDPFGFTQLPGSALEGASFASPQAGFASADGTFRAVFLEASRDLSDYRASAGWLAEVQAVLQQAQASPGWPQGVTVRHTGAPAFASETAASMASDIQSTVLGTLVVIAALFGWAHRSWRPLSWLVAMLVLIMAGALGAAGLIFGTLNAVSLGFGAILAGLAVDYGLVVYEETAAHPELSVADLRRRTWPALLWSAVTTAAAFLILNFAGLPGLSQLGTLVGVGLLLAPLVMLFAFLPLVARHRPARPARDATAADAPGSDRTLALCRHATLLLAAVAAVVLLRQGIPVDPGNRSLEPGNLPASTALQELNAELGRRTDPLLVVVAGRDEGDVAQRLAEVNTRLTAVRSNGVPFSLLLPDALWPHPQRQEANRRTLSALAGQAPGLRAAAAEAGFTREAMGLTESLLRIWAAEATTSGGLWPTNEACRWLLQRAAARGDTQWLAAGAVFPEAGSPPDLAGRLDLQLPGVWLTGWSVLGHNLLRHVEHQLGWVLLALVLVVTGCLALAFRHWVEVALGLGALGFTLLLLQAIMNLTGLAWNLMSLAALPLLLGAGIDYSLHVLLALRRHGGHLSAVRRVTGRAVFLCAATTVAGFGSNAFSRNPGLASLGLVCAIGILVACLTAMILLPAWWLRWCGPAGRGAVTADRLSGPSSAYGPRLWRVGIGIGRLLPRGFSRHLAPLLAAGYRWLRPQRFQVLVQNLTPVLQGNTAEAQRTARALLGNFALKLADLLRHEGGPRPDIALTRWSGYENLEAARAQRQGVLLVTPHLGNWELGGCLLAGRGVPMLVLTQAEPGRGLTEMRQQARARWGVDTLVIGQDAFAFVEVIRRLQDGAVVALLVDRPPAPTAVTVDFFGQPFQASIAPAELARATGCAVLPVYVVAEGDGYAAHVLPALAYDRQALGNREARRAFAGEILRAFEPVLRQHADQWYHFVPLWRDNAR